MVLRNLVFKRKYLLLFLFYLCFFILLVFKDVFSTRSLIPNLEPYPDTLHYITGAKSLIEGHGLTLTREGRSMKVSVPPLYSLSLVPFLLISKDPRVFYFVNLILAFASLGIFTLILKKIINNFLIVSLTLLFYITNFYIYWLPTVAMAENLTQLLFLGGILLLISKITMKNIILAGFIVVAFYATKYASITLSLSMGLLYLIKIFNEERTILKKKVVIFIITFLIFGALFEVSEYLAKGTNILITWGFLLKGLFFSAGITRVGEQGVSHSTWFSTVYFSTNLPLYLKSLIGNSINFLWNYSPLIDKFIGVVGLLGLFLGLSHKKYRFLSASLLLMLFSAIFFLSTFYAVDGRYINHAIPTLIIGFTLCLVFIREKIMNKNLIKSFYLALLIIAAFYLKNHLPILKNQIALNFRHTETPWYYVSVLELNNYFSKNQGANKKPIVISSLPPYFVDYYSNGNYSLLPLSRDQEFPGKWEAVWGPNDYSNLLTLYTKYLKEGYPVYVDKYGLGNVESLRRDFSLIQSNFKWTKVKEGCYGSCNIYKLYLKQ